MNRTSLKTAFPFAIILLLVPIVIMSCGQERDSAKKESPAKINNPVKEDKLTTITLTPRAEERLGVETVPATYRHMPGIMELGGEIIAPPGTEIKISAPLSWTGMRAIKCQSIIAMA